MFVTMEAMTAPPRPRDSKSGRYTRVEAAERRTKILTERNMGKTWEEIAHEMGMSERAVRSDYTKGLHQTVRIPAEHMVDRQRSILLDILRTEYPDAIDRAIDPNVRHAAQGRILDALKHEAQLYGLFQPAKLQLGVSAADFAAKAVELLKVTGTKPLKELAGIVDAEVIEHKEPPKQWSNL